MLMNQEQSCVALQVQRTSVGVFEFFLIKLIHNETVQMLIFNALHGGIRHSPEFLLGIMAPLQGICWNG